MPQSPHLFAPLTIRNITMRNRIAVSPMCQYSCKDGMATHWHLVHLGSRAVGGAGLVMAEATAIEPEGRISPGDLGLWKEEQIPALAEITCFIKSQHAVPGIQLAHAGRKASCDLPWKGGAFLTATQGGWQPVAPSPLPFRPNDPAPSALKTEEIIKLTISFQNAARRALEAGFEVLEIHAAHGYLIHEFLSPLSNQRTDQYGGTFENRIRFLLEVVHSVRVVWPQHLPLFVRISSTDWVDGGWDIEASLRLAGVLKEQGVDLIDCSSGGSVPHAVIPIAPGYQVTFAEQIKKKTSILTGAVGLITEPAQANQIIQSGQADIVLLAREFLRTPYWPLKAAAALSQEVHAPSPYLSVFH
ncbi:MAG: NADH:flavin oxidoreductase/NADH oxidase [Chthoniobacterales bacterium]